MLALFSFGLTAQGQSLEIMPGTERIFLDVQYLKFFDEGRKFSLFSRTRATAEYDGASNDIFTGAYLNYTNSTGFGATILGRIASRNAGIDGGIHFFKARPNWMIFALTSIQINDELLYSWFSILRYTPALNKSAKLYLGLELFTAMGSEGHLSSVQRLRVGIDHRGFQFGLALNMTESRFAETDINPGIFIRKQF